MSPRVHGIAKAKMSSVSLDMSAYSPAETAQYSTSKHTNTRAKVSRRRVDKYPRKRQNMQK